MHNIPPRSRDLKDHNGKFLQHPPTTAKSEQASKNPLSFFCFLILLPRAKASKSQWTASTLKGKHQPKKDYPEGSPPVPKEKVYFLQI